MLQDDLFRELLSWLARFEQLTVAIALVIFLISSLAVIYSAHMTRQMYGSLQVLQQDQDDLDSEYEKLLLEQSAWADYTRVDQLARDKLGMSAPSRDKLYVVKTLAVSASGVLR